MTEFIGVAWPLILLIAPVIGAVAAFWQQTLQIRELRFKIRDLERREEERDNQIHKPTPEEIEEYSKVFWSKNKRVSRDEFESLNPHPATRFPFWIFAFSFLLLLFGFVIQVSKFRNVTNELKQDGEAMVNELNRQKEEIKKLREENQQLKERMDEKEKIKQ